MPHLKFTALFSFILNRFVSLPLILPYFLYGNSGRRGAKLILKELSKTSNSYGKKRKENKIFKVFIDYNFCMRQQ